MTTQQKLSFGIGAGQAGRYGCTRCQQFHYSDEPVFLSHAGFQDKHSIQAYPESQLLEMRKRHDADAAAQPEVL